LRIVSGSYGKTLLVWETTTGVLQRNFTGHTGLVKGCAFSTTGAIVLSWCEDPYYPPLLWDPATGAVLHSLLDSHEDVITGMCWSPDETTVISTSGDRNIKIWSAASGLVLFTLEGHAHGVTSVSFSPDGSTVASGSAKTICLWNPSTGRLKQTLRTGSDILDCCFHPDSDMLISTHSDGALNLWG
jgi:WD40 repeat protein